MNSTSSLLFTLFSVPAPLTSRVFTCSSEVPDTLQYTDYHMKTMHNAQFPVPAPFTSRVFTYSSEAPDTLQYTDYRMKTMHNTLFFPVPAPLTSRVTLRASLSGTFLQTLPELVMPLKGHSYLHAAVHRCGQSPPKELGTNKTVET